jgi:hypothetical protein
MRVPGECALYRQRFARLFDLGCYVMSDIIDTASARQQTQRSTGPIDAWPTFNNLFSNRIHGLFRHTVRWWEQEFRRDER